MVEAALNGIWFVVAIGVLAASWRSSRRIKIALICAVALLFPIISISDDLSTDRTLTDADIADARDRAIAAVTAATGASLRS